MWKIIASEKENKLVAKWSWVMTGLKLKLTNFKDY